MRFLGLSAVPAGCKNSATCRSHNDLRSLATMRNIYRSFLVLIAGATQKELLRHNRFLMVQSQAMRKKLPLRIEFSAQERRRLARFATPLGGALDHLVSIVHPDTMR